MTLPLWTDRFVGQPYAWRNRAKGFDCYNLELEIWREIYGVQIADEFDPPENDGPTARLLWQARSVKSGEKLWTQVRPQPQTTVLIKVQNLPIHLAHYLGGGKILEACRKSGAVVLSDLAPISAADRVLGYYRPENYGSA